LRTLNGVIARLFTASGTVSLPNHEQIFDIVGGVANTTSLLELMNTIGELHGHAPEIRFPDWRTTAALRKQFGSGSESHNLRLALRAEVGRDRKMKDFL